MLFVDIIEGKKLLLEQTRMRNRDELKASDMQVLGTEHLLRVWAYIFFCL